MIIIPEKNATNSAFVLSYGAIVIHSATMSCVSSLIVSANQKGENDVSSLLIAT